MFYQQIIRPRRYGVFLVKLLLFLIISTPGFALMSWHWSRPDTGAKGVDDPIYLACFFTMIFTLSFGMIVCCFVDMQSSWKTILQQTAYCYIMVLAIKLSTFWRLGYLAPRQQIPFLFQEAPYIVGRYIKGLPIHGLSDGWWLFKIVLECLIQTKPDEDDSISKGGNSTSSSAIVSYRLGNVER